MSHYPTLDVIDGLRPGNRTLAQSPNGVALEREARRLVSEYWSDNAWITGQVSATALATVAERLDRMA